MPMHPARQARAQPLHVRDALALAGFLALSYAAALVGNLGMWLGDWQPWYDALAKPAWTPPGALIGAVWSVLYALMGVAAWLVWRAGGGWRGAARLPLGLFVAQLVLNALWTPVFFGAKELGMAFGVICGLWVAIALTLAAFARVRPLAAWLLAPYLAWVTFAGYLNWTIWQLNA
jgi:benzodiazapine receptor